MSKLEVQNLGNKQIDVEAGQTVLRALQQAGIDWMHACGGKGRCTSCRMIVLNGMEHTAPLTAPELRFRQNGRLKENERLTCQCMLLTGTVVVRVPKQTQLPHMVYTA